MVFLADNRPVSLFLTAKEPSELRTILNGIFPLLYRMNQDITVLPEKPLTDEELFEMMKAHPEFECLPKPASWFKKFNLQPVSSRNFKEFIDDRAWEKAREMPVDQKEIRKEPAPGGVRPVFPSEVIPMEIISRPITKDEVWGLAEQEERESKTEPTFKVSEIQSEGCAVSPK